MWRCGREKLVRDRRRRGCKVLSSETRGKSSAHAHTHVCVHVGGGGKLYSPTSGVFKYTFLYHQYFEELRALVLRVNPLKDSLPGCAGDILLTLIFLQVIGSTLMQCKFHLDPVWGGAGLLLLPFASQMDYFIYLFTQ